MLMDAVMEAPQKSLFNIETKAIDPYWIDPLQPLLVPVNPLHYEAHKLQLLLARLEIQSRNNPAQFNSQTYIATLNRFTEICKEINKSAANDAGNLAENGIAGAAQALGNGNAAGLGARISTDNPLAG